jgi:hypothetical protein
MDTDALQKSGICKWGNSAIGESPTMRQKLIEFGDRMIGDYRQYIAERVGTR